MPIPGQISVEINSLRKAVARTVDTLRQAIGALLDDFTPEECANSLTNSGYAAV